MAVILSVSFVWPSFGGAEGILSANRPMTGQEVITDLQILISSGGSPHPADNDSGLMTQILYVLGIEVGEKFDQEKLEKGCDRLRSIPGISLVKGESKFYDQGIGLTIILERTPMVREIKISGNYPLFENEVRKVISTRPGDPFDMEIIRQNAEDVKRLYHEEGYSQARVFIQHQESKKDRNVVVTFRIEKGVRTRIKNVELEVDGEPAADPSPYLRLMKIYPGSFFHEAKLKTSLQNLENDLVHQGFLKVRVDPQVIHVSPGWAVVKIMIQQGPRIRIQFQGNNLVSDEQIRQEIALFENRSYAEFDLQESVEDIKAVYFRLGFLFVEVSYEKKILDQHEVLISFFIQEGQKVFLKKITFQGNHGLSTRKLRGQMLILQRLLPLRRNVFDKLLYEDDLKALKTLYTFEGYPWVEIEEKSTFSSGQRFISKEITIREGNQLIVSRVTFSGNSLFRDAQLMKMISLKPGTHFTDEKWRHDQRALAVFYSNHGYVFVRITPKAHVHKDMGKVDLSYQIDEGQRAFFGKHIIIKNVKTRYSVIRDSLAFSEGEPFSYQKIVESSNKLNDLGLFRTVRVKPLHLDKRKRDIDILVEVEEMNTGRINFGLGYNSVKGYRGYMEWRENNLAGTALGFALRYEYSGIGEEYDLSHEIKPFQKASLDVRDPLLVPQMKIEGNVSLFNILEVKKDYYDLQQTGMKIRLGKPLGESIRLSLTYRLEADQLHEIKIKVSDDDPIIGSIKPLFSFDSRDQILDPRRGGSVQLGLELAGSFMGGESRFSKLTAEAARFFPLSKRSVLALGFTGGYLWAPTGGEIPPQELFFTGGLNSVRGYPEDSLGPQDDERNLPRGGRVLLVHNIELRRDLFRRLKLVLFFDMGNVWEEKEEITIASLRTSTGLGFRLVTPVGPIRADYGWILDRRSGEPAGTFYLSVGHAF
ncbi:MAG: outer membrane protein assembly factor BamA [bacterium]